MASAEGFSWSTPPSMAKKHPEKTATYSAAHELDPPLVVQINFEMATIRLSGDLTGTRQVRSKLAEALSNANQRSSWTVEANAARVIPAGVEVWIKATREHLGHSALTYEPSQLAMILQFDETYTHPSTRFNEDFLKDG